jgi:hypothetical protein
VNFNHIPLRRSAESGRTSVYDLLRTGRAHRKTTQRIAEPHDCTAAALFDLSG